MHDVTLMLVLELINHSWPSVSCSFTLFCDFHVLYLLFIHQLLVKYARNVAGWCNFFMCRETIFSCKTIYTMEGLSRRCCVTVNDDRCEGTKCLSDGGEFDTGDKYCEHCKYHLIRSRVWYHQGEHGNVRFKWNVVGEHFLFFNNSCFMIFIVQLSLIT